MQGYPVVTLVGPRQSGKTTLARALFSEKPYFNLENPTLLARFEADPEGFVRQLTEGAVLDEVQRAPQLASYLQAIVDERKELGMFVLTGSQQLGVPDGVTQSLAGRTAIAELLPLGWTELQAAGEKFSSVEAAMWTGGYPALFDRPVTADRWHSDYLATYVQRDVRQALRVRDLGQFSSFLSLCASHASQQVNYARWASDLGVDGKTVKGWLSVLEATYVAFRLRPHHRNFRKRIVKSPKLYFYDTGLLCRLLEIASPADLTTHPLGGAIFENWAVAELVKGRAMRGQRSNLYFWRDASGHEVDVIADQGAKLLPIEIKSSRFAYPKLAKGLARWRDLAGDAAGPATLIYQGDEKTTIASVEYLPWHHISSLAEKI